jgi:hypothetical protein
MTVLLVQCEVSLGNILLFKAASLLKIFLISWASSFCTATSAIKQQLQT